MKLQRLVKRLPFFEMYFSPLTPVESVTLFYIIYLFNLYGDLGSSTFPCGLQYTHLSIGLSTVLWVEMNHITQPQLPLIKWWLLINFDGRSSDYIFHIFLNDIYHIFFPENDKGTRCKNKKFLFLRKCNMIVMVIQLYKRKGAVTVDMNSCGSTYSLPLRS